MKHMKRLLLGSALSLATLAALAQSSMNPNDLSTNATACNTGADCGSIGTSAGVCVPPINPSWGGNYPRAAITIANSSATATISVGYNNTITVNGLGTITLSPGQSAYWPKGGGSGAPLYCVASGSSTPAQVVLWN